ncbi:MAG: TonB-dependent receptor [Cyclobacteriaceae bacterium]
MSKLALYAIVVCQSLLMAMASESLAQRKYLSEINIQLDAITQEKEIPLVKLLTEIESSSDFNFAFTKGAIKDKKIHLKSNQWVFLDLLNEISTQGHFSINRVNETITLIPVVNGSFPEINEEILVQQSIEGVITDQNGEPLPGASVVEKGTSNGTITDIEGKFNLTVSNDAILILSFVGFKTMEVPANGRSVFNIRMDEDTEQLEEVVVIGYGSTKKSDLTGSVSSASGEQLQERPTSSLPQALSGRIAGASVTQNSGRPGGQTRIRIRGNTSVSLDNSPLFVVDGVIMAPTTTVATNGGLNGLNGGTSPIDYINANDIASVEVLKDASATAIYGARGANGVVLVTTKRGSKSGATLNYDSYYSMGVMARKMGVLNSEQFMMIEEVAYQNAQKYDSVGWAGGTKYTDPLLKRTDPRLFDTNGNPLYDTDWQDEVTQNAFSQNHQLSFTGGGENGSFGAFLGYTGEEGLMKISWMKRYSARFVFDSKIRDWLDVGGNLSYNNQHERIIHGSWVGRNMIEAIPMIPVKYPDGTWASNLDYPGMEGGPNPVQVGEEYKNFLRTHTILGNAFVNVRFAESLVLRSSVGVNSITQGTNEYAGRELNFIGTPTNGYAQKNSQQYFSWQFENYLTYNKRFADIHSLTAMLGLSWQKTTSESYNVRVNDFSDDFFSYNNLGAGAVLVPPNSSAWSEGFNSYFGRINYGLQNKYLLTVTGRIDGSSKFGANNRYAFFPSAALAWRVSEEGFLSGSDLISNLKLRTSYGETGNANIPPYSDQAGLSSNYSYVIGGNLVTGIGKGSLANSDLKWERTVQVDAGVEIGLFQGRVALEADVYRKETTDMLLNAPVPQSSGFATVYRNIGSMENKGVELSLTTVNIENNGLLWETTFNYTSNKNKVLALSGGSDIFQSKGIIREGEPVNSFWGWVHLGTWGSDEGDAAQALNPSWVPGDIKLADLNGDGAINNDDKTIIGNGLPDGYGSFINTVNFKNFEFILDLQYTYGNDIMYITTRPQENRQGIANSLSTVLDAWTPENQDTEIAQWRPVSAGYDNRDTDHMIQDGSFIRGRNMLLGYNFSSDLLSKIDIQKLRLYVSVQNFFLLTKYQGYDPEASTNNIAFNSGEVNFQQYPRPKVFMVGMNLSF